MRSLAVVAMLLSYPSQSPPAADGFSRAVELQRRGDFAGAEREYRAVLVASPDYAEAHANLGAVLARLERYDEAVAAYERALGLAPRLTPVILNLGIAFYRQAQFDKAVDSLRRFLAASPGHLQATQLAGLALVELGRDAEAIELLTRSLDEAPSDPATLYGLGLALLRSERPGVRGIAGRLAAAPGGQAAARLLQGQAYLAGLEFERAVEDLEAARGISSSLPRLDYSLGLAYLKLGRNVEATDAFTRELARKPKDFSTLYYLAYLGEAAGDTARTRMRLEAALALEPESAEANALLGKILLKEGKAAEAVKPLETAVGRDREDSEKRFLLARVYQQLGRREEAAREFAEVERLKGLHLERDRARTPKP